MIQQVAPTLKAPLVLFTYYNPIIRRGMDKFCEQIKEAGASGALAIVLQRLSSSSLSWHCIKENVLESAS
jgi:tryptophan synthase alpha chain